MEQITLEKLFLDGRQKLVEELAGLMVPRDNERIKDTISNHFSALLEEGAEFRQHLTVSEDYILQAVLAVLNAQQAAYTCLPTSELSEKERSGAQTKDPRVVNVAAASVAAGVGALAGGALIGTWGSVCGAIACTALAAYFVSPHIASTREAHSVADGKPLDAEALAEVVRRLCQSVDEIIATFRAQINNVIQKYENRVRPSVESEFSTLLEGIQSLIGYQRAHKEDEKFQRKVQERIEDLAELLENYNLVTVDYDGTNAALFVMVPSPNTTEPKQVFPAIVKAGQAVLKGKVFIPEI